MWPLPVCAPAAATIAVAALLASGCGGGGVVAEDLFVVTRSGGAPHARLTLLVNEEGGVTCDGRLAEEKLEDPQIIKARDIQEDLQKPASENLSLPARPGSVFSYRVRDENGTVAFADNSAGQPKVLHELQLFVVQTSQGICHLPE